VTDLSKGYISNHEQTEQRQPNSALEYAMMTQHVRYSGTSLFYVKSCITVTASTNSTVLRSREHCHTRQDQRYDFWNLARAPGPPNLQAERAMSAHQLSCNFQSIQAGLHAQCADHIIALTSQGLELSLLQCLPFRHDSRRWALQK